MIVKAALGPGPQFLRFIIQYLSCMRKPDESCLVKGRYLLQKFPGKGGWTYAAIPEIKPDQQSPFGWVMVKGSIDGVVISKYRLMPMGDGRLFLPVKKEIRQKIKKQAGDWVEVFISPDQDPLIIPDDLVLCLQDEPDAYRFFQSLSESEQLNYIKWIFEAKTAATRESRIATAVKQLLRKEKRKAG